MTVNGSGYLFVYLGTSKSGRKIIAGNAAEKFGLNKIVKYASRDRKAGDEDGSTQHFMSKEEFQDAQAAGKFIAVTKNDDGDLFGVTREQIENAIADGQSAYLTIPNPMDDLLETFNGRVIRIFTYTTREDFIRLLKDAGETEEKIAKKLEFYDRKLELLPTCDHAFQNDNLDETLVASNAAVGGYVAR
ncbi:guanylate kinase [Devosia sp. YR412]|uniref:hypothetical protein n=1 Tax=Devosia sp. YR412 TaxID=1881030 RepID=UPI0008AD4231|nr:hypothetical protein [Devosia sp. YR412]SEQ10820.1 guanylate kinase [Devosia sp. YR412]